MVNYDLTEINDYTNTCYVDLTQEQYDEIQKEKRMEIMPCPIVKCDDGYIQMKRKTNTLIFIMATTIGFDEINERNYERVFSRINYVEKMNGAYHSAKDFDGKVEPLYFTLDDIKNHIGLKTNGERLTKTQFLSRVTNQFDL